jgi:hypothetical protein
MGARDPIRGLTLLLLAGLLVAVLAGCGGTSKQSTPAAQRLEREDLVAVSRSLKSEEQPVAQEVAATKALWPLIANGLPADTTAISRASGAADATQAAAQLKLPELFSEAQASTLTGPAAQLAGLFRSYVLLSSRGWKLLDANIEQIESGSQPGARFARANAALYIESIYDGHFTLAQIGKKLSEGYGKLGGPTAFGTTLSQAEVDALARSYSEASDRLHPHVGVRLGS